MLPPNPKSTVVSLDSLKSYTQQSFSAIKMIKCAVICKCNTHEDFVEERQKKTNSQTTTPNIPLNLQDALFLTKPTGFGN